MAATPEEINQAAQEASGAILRGAQATERLSARPESDWQRQILWVDDVPSNNQYERRALESLGLEFTLARSTAEAMAALAERQFAAIISDMSRPEGRREGYVLLEKLRASGNQAPYFIYSSLNSPRDKQEAAARGARGLTSVPQELFDMVTRTLHSRTVG